MALVSQIDKEEIKEIIGAHAEDVVLYHPTFTLDTIYGTPETISETHETVSMNIQSPFAGEQFTEAEIVEAGDLIAYAAYDVSIDEDDYIIRDSIEYDVEKLEVWPDCGVKMYSKILFRRRN